MKLLYLLVGVLALAWIPPSVTSLDSKAIPIPETTDTKADAPPPRSDPKDVITEPMLEPFYVPANWFVEDLVQLRYLYDLEKKLGTNFTSFKQMGETWVDNWEEWTAYLIGYTLCATVGTVLIIAMPFIGGFIACCRCCGRCGARIPSPNKSSGCKRYCCSFALLIITASLAFGTAGLFIANEEIKERLVGKGGEGMGDSNMFAELGMSLDAMDNYLDTTLDEFNSSVLGQFIEGQENLFLMLDDIPANSLNALDDATGVVENLNELADLTYGLEDTKMQMEEADNLTTILNGTLTELEAALDEVTANISLAIDACISATCNNTRMKLNNLTVGVNTYGIEFSTAIAAIDVAVAADIETKVNASISSLQNISTEVENQIQGTVDGVKDPIDDVQADIATFLVDLEEDLAKIDFDNATKALDDAAKETEDIASYVYWSILSLGIVLCVTLLCNVVGVVAGMAFPRPDIGDTAACSNDSRRGADWLLAGLTLTFIFYWLYTSIVMATFLAGGIAQTELCTHAVHYENDKSERVLEIFDRMINNSLYDMTGVQLEFFKVYGDCQTNTSFYRALDLESRGYNVSEIVDLTTVEEAIGKLKDVDVVPPTIDIMDSTFEDALQALDAGFDSVMYEEIYSELDNDVVTEDLADIADMLEIIAQVDGITEVQDYAVFLERLIVSHVEPANQTKTELVQEIGNIEDETSSNLTAIAENLTLAEDTINTDGETILKAYLNDTTDELFNETVGFSIQLESDVRNEVGRCYPAFEAMTLAIDATCVKSLYPLNGFWWSLGWVLFWFIPSIILSFVLVKEFRITSHRVKMPSFDEPFPGTIDAFSAPNPSHMLIAPVNNSFVTEFDNPIYDNEFKIPRPSLKTDSNGANSAPQGSSTNPAPRASGSEFKIPRPSVYGDENTGSKHSSPPSYRSMDEDETEGGVVNPSAENTRL